MKETPPQWLIDFFHVGNGISLDKVLDESYGHEYQELLAPLIKRGCEGKWPILLPAKTNRLWFYAAEQDKRRLLELERYLAAFLGSADTYSNPPIITVPEHPTEKVLLAKSPSGVIRFTLLDNVKDNFEAQKRVFNALAQLSNLYDQRPEISSTVRRPFGRILRDFFTAYSAKNGEKARKYYNELNGCENLSQRNLISIELQTLATEENWTAILKHPHLENILSGRISQRLIQILLRSIGETGLSSIINEGDYSKHSLERARQLCEPLNSVFLGIPAFEHCESFIGDWKLWSMGAVATGKHDFSQYLPKLVEQEWVDKLTNWAGIKGNNTKTEASVTNETVINSMDDVMAMLQHSLIAPSDQLPRIIESLEKAPRDLLSQIEQLPRINQLWQSLKEEVEVNERGWSEWFEELWRPDCDVNKLQSEAFNDYQSWKGSSFDLSLVLSLLDTGASDTAGIVLRNIIPILIDWLDERQVDCQGRFWVSLLELLALDEIVTTEDLNLAGLVAQRILITPHSRDEYRLMIDAILLLWDKGASIPAYRYLVDIAENLLESSSPDSQKRLELWQEAQKFALNRWGRLDRSEKLLTECLTSELLGKESLSVFPELIPETLNDCNERLLPELQGSSLAIYSLTEGACRRAKGILTSMFTGLHVEINHDHVATPALINLAKKADYFIFATNSSKHQAFYPVIKIRNDLIYPQGKGTSSIVSAFLKVVT